MKAQTDLRHTCFYDFHVRHGAKMVDFAGWAMPLLYRSIIAEHQHTRRYASIFDVSHMGRLHFSGAGAPAFLEHVLTRDLADTVVGQSRYSLVCNPQGGILDDVIISRFEKHWLMVCNAANRAKLGRWFQDQSTRFDVRIKDETENTAMVAIQGPAALPLLDSLLPEPAGNLLAYHFAVQHYLFLPFTVFRSGYTGEDGVEIICSATAAKMAVDFLLRHQEQASSTTLQPAGLGARDTLRLEAGLPLYGHELSELVDPIAAGLGWAVAQEKRFIGSEILSRIRRDGPARRMVGLLVDGPRIPRPEMEIWRQGKTAGRITSGAASPTLGRTIALAYLDSDAAAPGTAVEVDIRGQRTPAVVTQLPFYRRTNKGNDHGSSPRPVLHTDA